MARITRLAPHVADLIAAGEVVERPGSVVKELIENSIDAGAGAITVEIKNGGLTYIRVTDDGTGMDAQDAEAAFQRHATSKLREARDLEAIGTLGFRGEALAAIAAVSRIDILTRERGTGEGTGISLEGGALRESVPAGCPEGTTIIVRDLFFNTPARLKFMKTDRAEGANVTSVLLKCALSHPAVSFRYIRDGREEYHTPGDGDSRSCVYTLLGRDFAKDLIEVRGEDENLKIAGFATPPEAGRGSRSYQHFFVDGRYVRSKTLQAALERAYQNAMLQGRFPGCVLYLELRPGTVDVNVHPAKTEVKFLREKDVFSGVYYGVLSAIERSAAIPELDLPRKGIVAASVPDAGTSGKYGDPGAAPAPRWERLPPVFPKTADAAEVRSTSLAGYRKSVPVLRAAARGPQDPPAATRQAEAGRPAETDGEPAAFRIVGEALGAYIVVERAEGLILIDKHAAHERIIFDRLRAENYEDMPQTLLTPVTVSLGVQDTELLMENEELLRELGFEVDRFGSGSVALRQVPGDIEVESMEAFLSEICEKLAMGGGTGPGDRRDAVLHTVACKAAIKAGKLTPAAESAFLVERVLSGQVKCCPHGRPVSMELPKNTIDKSFKRT